MTIFRVWYLEVWGDEGQGFEVNDRRIAGTIEVEDVDSNDEIVEKLKGGEFLKDTVTVDELDIDGDDVTIGVNEAASGRPIYTLEKLAVIS